MTAQMSTAKTSITDPLRVDWLIPEGSGKGGLGLTIAPGKQGVGISGRWHRDLTTDITALKAMGVDTLVSLVTDEELRRLHIPELVATARASGIDVIRFPIPDGGVPPLMTPLAALVEKVAARLDSGKTLVAHCQGGLGRAGTIGACVLLRLGISGTAADAIAHVRRVRSPRAVETRGQEDLIGSYAAHLRGGVQ